MCDVFVFFDNALLPLGKSFVSRNAIKTAQGRQWLTVPIVKKQIPIADVTTVGDHWIRKHIASLSNAYADSRWRSIIDDTLEPVLSAGHETVADLNADLVD